MSRIRIIMYHYTRDLLNSRYPRINGLDIKHFKRQLDYLSQKYEIVKMEDLIESIYSGKELSDDSVLLTFDDGYIDNFLYALPILKDMGLQGSFFIPGKTFSTRSLLDVNKIHYTLASADIDEIYIDLLDILDAHRGQEYIYEPNEALIESYAKKTRFDDEKTVFVKRVLQTALPEKLRSMISSELFKEYVGIPEHVLASEIYMNEDQIRYMRNQGMHIGLHGWDHFWLGDMDKDDMAEDVDRSLDALGKYIDPSAWVMCYPYGSHNQNVRQYIGEKGAIVGLTTEVDIANPDKENALMLPRLDCNDFPPKSKNIDAIEARCLQQI